MGCFESVVCMHCGGTSYVLQLGSSCHTTPRRADNCICSLIIALQVTANPELRGVVARGANQLPTAVLQKAMRPLYGGPLNFVAFSRAVERLDGWYRDRGILGQVRH
jgi:outer membrane protein assembly factor BamA